METSLGLMECRLDPDRLELPKSRIAQGMGYTGAVPDLVADAIDTVCADLGRACRPRGAFRVFTDIACGRDRFRCADRQFATGALIGKYLEPSQLIALAVATVGPGYDELKQEYAREDEILLSYVLDAAGSELAELMAERVEEEIAAFARARGMGCSNRYSPGYCGWTVAEQQQLFALLPPGCCGISLNSSSLMTPIKSVSCVMGLGSGMVKAGYRCELCGMEHCFKKNLKG